MPFPSYISSCNSFFEQKIGICIVSPPSKPKSIFSKLIHVGKQFLVEIPLSIAISGLFFVLSQSVKRIASINL